MATMARRALPPIPGESPSQPQMVSVDFLLPTGMIVSQVMCSLDGTIREIKAQLFERARDYPLFSLLKDQSFYNFVGVTIDGEKEEFVNEAQTLEDLELFTYMFKLVERQGNQKEKLLNAEIGNLIGRRLHDFDVMGPEVQDFRRNVLKVCQEAVKQRNANQMELVRYAFPPELHSEASSLLLGSLTVTVYSVGSKKFTEVDMGPGTRPHDVIKLALKSKELKSMASRLHAEELVLKVSGREEYLLEEVPLHKYSYIATCLAKKARPTLILKPFAEVVPPDVDEVICPVHATASPITPLDPSQGPGSTGTLLRATASTEHSFTSVWEVKSAYAVKVTSAKNINVPENHKVYVRAAVYHGAEPLCSPVCTSKGKTPDDAVWNEILEFDLPVSELPRGAKLCFVVFGATDAAMNKKGRKRKKDVVPIAWVNMNVFDYASKLQTGRSILYGWPVEEELEECVNYMGSTMLNPSTSECVVLEVDCSIPNLSPSLRRASRPIMYPSIDQIRKVARELAEGSIPTKQFSVSEIAGLQKVVEQDPLAELDESDKEFIWKMRNVCLQQFPSSLPKLLQTISWNNRGDVAQCYSLLERWQTLPHESAMELLDYQYADVAVRSWAVDCLRTMTDSQLNMYLLQLVQVLKFEPYLDCALVHFLLQRGLANRKIGHFLFWHLRSEMHLPTVFVRFGLLLEAYCRGCGTSHLKNLTLEVTALSKMKNVSDVMQKKKKDEMSSHARDFMNDSHFKSCMEDLVSPLDPTLRCRALKVEECKVMDSKMRPLWLVFENSDTTGSDVLQIFKNGDDLRQDMLTLQMISIMDALWKSSGLDLRMNPYGCLATGNQVGMIEVVLNAATIAKIQKKKGARGAWDHKMLYLWLKENNPTPSEFDKAVENFTLSCAGSCVATYVLGIGDRHSDNIMLRKNGQLVHIDFGHFLGNFKSKFGVKRERVPFVLTDDFIYIITNAGDKNSPLFSKFKKTCEEAFLKLREKGSLFINLFTMMLSTGIPELKTTDDISYIRDALCLGERREVALEVFRKKIQEAMKNSWSVSLNWYFHNVTRNS